MPEANLARLGPAVPMVVVPRDCADAPGADLVLALLLILSPARPGPTARRRHATAPARPADYAVVALLLRPPLTRPGPAARRRLADSHATTPCRCEQRPIPWTQEMGRCFLARYRPNVFSEGARTAKRRLPGKIFAGCIPRQRFSPLFTAQIIHNELILPKTGRSSMHFSDILP